MEELTDEQKKTLVFALLSYTMKHGEASFKPIVEIATKLGVKPEFDFHLKDYIHHTQEHIKDILKGGSDIQEN